MEQWKKLSGEQARQRIEKALAENVDFNDGRAIGYPVSKLDGRVFHDAPFLKDAPVLMTYVSNPNHIGCHTLGTSESAFKGTQEIERDVLDMVACDVFHATPHSYDGYVAGGGTEANIQALWMFRNVFRDTYRARPEQIAIFASEDTHYSIAKGADLLTTQLIKVPVDFETRAIRRDALRARLIEARASGVQYAIVVANMGTTMFGSVDDPAVYTSLLRDYGFPFFLHVDAAYGGFIYPFLDRHNQLDFRNPDVSSVAVDAHKMLQAPYGTGIFLCRKGYIEHVLTKEADYVEGMDLTLSGSRSGANVVAVWMILKAYGYADWFEKVQVLQLRTAWLCTQLDALGVAYFREPNLNIVAIRASFIDETVAERYNLVPQHHTGPNDWYKVVIMQHVDLEILGRLVADIMQRVGLEMEIPLQ
ncbi:MAG TPA: pyridoxal-dependent decarboxylase [Flavobacterium sp.]|nr:pyridoxal-dependent decarboxylase [Flavobacterium sp.]